MRKSLRCTRWLAAVLAVALVRASTALAITAAPGTLAVLEPPITLPEMRAAWDGISAGIYRDPLLLTKAREEVDKQFQEWGEASASIRSAYQTADRITLDRTRALIEEAWARYYRFDYGQAASTLNEARKLLSTPGDSGFRTRLMFEVLLLSGMTARAAGEKNYSEDLTLAAALDPDRELSSEKYSPETISIYGRLKSELLRDKRVPLFLEGKPVDAVIEVDGREFPSKARNREYQLRPGKHFLGAQAPGYEPWGLVLDVRQFEPANVTFELVPAGPEGDPHTFFLRRLKEGDISYLLLLADKLNVDYLLLPDPQENRLQAWLIDSEGRTVDHAVLWETGNPLESGSAQASKLLRPLRQELDRSRALATAPLSLPVMSPAPSGDDDTIKVSSTWKTYAVAIGVILLLGAASAEGSGSTRIEAVW